MHSSPVPHFSVSGLHTTIWSNALGRCKHKEKAPECMLFFWKWKENGWVEAALGTWLPGGQRRSTKAGAAGIFAGRLLPGQPCDASQPLLSAFPALWILKEKNFNWMKDSSNSVLLYNFLMPCEYFLQFSNASWVFPGGWEASSELLLPRSPPCWMHDMTQQFIGWEMSTF